MGRGPPRPSLWGCLCARGTGKVVRLRPHPAAGARSADKSRPAKSGVAWCGLAGARTGARTGAGAGAEVGCGARGAGCGVWSVVVVVAMEMVRERETGIE